MITKATIFSINAKSPIHNAFMSVLPFLGLDFTMTFPTIEGHLPQVHVFAEKTALLICFQRFAMKCGSLKPTDSSLVSAFINNAHSCEVDISMKRYDVIIEEIYEE